MENLVTVVVPVYRPTLSDLDEFALRRCTAVLSRHPLTLVGPQSLDYRDYLAIAPNAQVVRLNDLHFASKANYNALMSSLEFYEQFVYSRFILVHELDAFVFEDHLKYWCDQGHDYIGAPWFKDFGADKTGKFIGVGNSGLCLRNVQGHLQVLRSTTADHRRLLTDLLVQGRQWKKALRYVRNLLQRPRGRSQVLWHLERFYFANGVGNDLFWGVDAVKFAPDFRVAPVEQASQFAFEMGLDLIHTRYLERLPFGCHAWWNLKKLYSMLYRDQEAQDKYDACLLDIYRRATVVCGA